MSLLRAKLVTGHCVVDDACLADDHDAVPRTCDPAVSALALRGILDIVGNLDGRISHVAKCVQIAGEVRRARPPDDLLEEVHGEVVSVDGSIFTIIDT
jgi:hypothetical protein